METLRCLISDIPRKLLSDIVMGITRQHENIEVVGRTANREELNAILQKQAIDVLILGLDKHCFPDYCRELLDEFSDLQIVGLVDDGRLAVVYLDDVGSQEIIDVISRYGKRRKG